MAKLHPELLTEAQRLAVEHPHDIAAVYSAISQDCLFASPSHFDILGYTDAEMMGQSWKKFVAPKDHAHATLAGADAVLLGRSIEFSFNAVTKAGEYLPLRGSSWIRTNLGTLYPFMFFRAHRVTSNINQDML